MNQRLPVPSSMVAALSHLQKLCVSFYVTTLGSGPGTAESVGGPELLCHRRLKISVLILGCKFMFENDPQTHAELQGADPAHFTAPADLAGLQLDPVLEGFPSAFLSAHHSEWNGRSTYA